MFLTLSDTGAAVPRNAHMYNNNCQLLVMHPHTQKHMLVSHTRMVLSLHDNSYKLGPNKSMQCISSYKLLYTLYVTVYTTYVSV